MVANASTAPGIEPVQLPSSRIGPGAPIFVIAEIGINHNQSLAMAKDLIDAAADAKCQAAKFQTFTAEALYVDRKFSGSYKLMGRELPIFDLHKGLEMPDAWIPELVAHCKKRGILFFSTPVHPPAVDILEANGVELYKISSYDMTNLPLIEYTASKKKPIIFSTGAATLSEVEETALAIRASGTPFAIMHCIAKYPAPYRYANLAVMETLRSAFQVPVGFSDNGFASDDGKIDTGQVPAAAAKAGADLFEIHITLDRTLPGADHGFATEPNELKAMVAEMQQIRADYNAGMRFDIDSELWGSPVKRTYDVETYVRDFAYKGLYATRDIAAGEKLDASNVKVLRPGAHKVALPPRYHKLVLARAHASRAISAWEPILWDNILA